MKVIVTGGRNYEDIECVEGTLMQIHSDHRISLLVHGNCPTGADRLADNWARRNFVPIVTYPADWLKHGRAAGPIRNSAMIKDGADLVVAFHGGTGTADCVRKARNAKINILEVNK